MSSISGPTSPNYDPIWLKAVTDAATHEIEKNLSDINDAIKNAGDPNYDPTDPSQN